MTRKIWQYCFKTRELWTWLLSDIMAPNRFMPNARLRDFHSSKCPINKGPNGLRALKFPHWFGPTCMVCPLAPWLTNFSIMAAADVRTNQRWPLSISVRESSPISSGIARLGRLCGWREQEKNDSPVGDYRLSLQLVGKRTLPPHVWSK